MVAINPDYAPAKTAPRSKNRVGNFFSGTSDCVGSDRSATRNRIREKRPCSYDTASGVTYYGFRYYDPVTGRWLSRDPIGEHYSTGEFNLYAFIANDPSNFIDIAGLQKSRGSGSSTASSPAFNEPGGLIDRTLRGIGGMDPPPSHTSEESGLTFREYGPTSCPEGEERVIVKTSERYKREYSGSTVSSGPGDARSGENMINIGRGKNPGYSHETNFEVTPLFEGGTYTGLNTYFECVKCPAKLKGSSGRNLVDHTSWYEYVTEFNY